MGSDRGKLSVGIGGSLGERMLWVAQGRNLGLDPLIFIYPGRGWLF